MFIRRIYSQFLKLFGSPMAYAKYIGVNIGTNNLIKKIIGVLSLT